MIDTRDMRADAFHDISGHAQRGETPPPTSMPAPDCRCIALNINNTADDIVAARFAYTPSTEFDFSHSRYLHVPFTFSTSFGILMPRPFTALSYRFIKSLSSRALLF